MASANRTLHSVGKGTASGSVAGATGDSIHVGIILVEPIGRLNVAKKSKKAKRSAPARKKCLLYPRKRAFGYVRITPVLSEVERRS